MESVPHTRIARVGGFITRSFEGPIGTGAKPKDTEEATTETESSSGADSMGRTSEAVPPAGNPDDKTGVAIKLKQPQL